MHSSYLAPQLFATHWNISSCCSAAVSSMCLLWSFSRNRSFGTMAWYAADVALYCLSPEWCGKYLKYILCCIVIVWWDAIKSAFHRTRGDQRPQIPKSSPKLRLPNHLAILYWEYYIHNTIQFDIHTMQHLAILYSQCHTIWYTHNAIPCYTILTVPYNLIYIQWYLAILHSQYHTIWYTYNTTPCYTILSIPYSSIYIH